MYVNSSGRIVAAGSIIYRYSNQFFIRRMRELDIAGCYPPYLVEVARNEGTNQEEISRSLHMDKGQVARVIKKLIAGGFIRREPDEHDKRNYRLYMTDKGWETLPKLKALDEELSGILMENMEDAQREQFLDLADIAAMNILRDKGIKMPGHSCSSCNDENCPRRQRASGADRTPEKQHSTKTRSERKGQSKK